MNENTVILKHCNTCNCDKPITDFYVSKANKDGHSSQCKECINKRQKRYNDTHKEEIHYRDAEYRKRNAEKLKEYSNSEYKKAYRKLYREQHKEKQAKIQKEWYIKNREKVLERQKQYYKTHTDVKRKYYQQNLEKIKIYSKIYRVKNIEEIHKRDKERHNKNKLNNNFSNMIWHSLKNKKNEQHWEDLVPYNLQQLKEHLESQFDENMTWDNYGEYWEVDHIIPQGLFNITNYTDREFQICWSLLNLRPLEWKANRSRPKDGRDISEELKQQIIYESGKIYEQNFQTKV